MAKSEKWRWAELIEGYLNDEGRDLALVVLLVDMRHPATRLDVDMVNYLIETEKPFLVVLTKADKLNKTEREKRLAGDPRRAFGAGGRRRSCVNIERKA